MKIYDISREISNSMLIYPGDAKTIIKPFKKIPKSSSNTSIITIGSHVGTHVDANKHFNNKGKGVEAIPLSSLVGNCKVIDVSKAKKKIEIADLNGKNIVKGDIIILKTANSNIKGNTFKKNFVHLSEEAVRYLVKRKISTVGIDYLSIDKFHSGNHPNHHIFLSKGVTILEGLNLNGVREGSYLLAALPLKINDIDGAPVRAVLIKN